MGQKVNPKSFRLGPVYTWESRWFANKKRYQEIVLEDVKIKKALFDRLKIAGLCRVEIERSINSLTITLYVARPGVVIGRGGTGLEDLKKFLVQILGAKNTKSAPKIDLRVEPVKEPNLEAYLVASSVVDQLIKRLPYKRILRQMAERVMGQGAKGVRILLSGRIAGAEISRREKIQSGTIPLSTIRAKIDFASVPALTKSGYIGVKVWINRP
ncbi:30S ribosomal protein S3 [Candidatus Microgenomates bacterium]|nr:30S ribosomal protein S3 [Candidatus Microgenomates bacterium]MBI2622172.1 30S ribosomal protein S3 [Candidatus Microgenomates bacterium]